MSEPFVPLSGPHSLDCLKSSLIYETMVNWHQIDWWDSPHPHVCLNRCARPISGHQQGWRDDKLCHEVLSDTIPKCLVDVMIALALLSNHHYMGQLSTIEPPSTLKNYKSMTEIEEIGTVRSLSLCLRVAIYSQSLTWPLEGVSRHFCTGKPKSQILAPERELSLPWLKEESILSWPGINTLNNISSTFYLMVTLSPRSYLQSLTSFFCLLTHLTPWPTLSLHQHIYFFMSLSLINPPQPPHTFVS